MEIRKSQEVIYIYIYNCIGMSCVKHTHPCSDHSVFQNVRILNSVMIKIVVLLVVDSKRKVKL